MDIDFDKIKDHLDHADSLEVKTEMAANGVPAAVTVDCTICGDHVATLYDSKDLAEDDTWSIRLELNSMAREWLDEGTKPGDMIELQLEACDKNFEAVVLSIESIARKLFICNSCGQPIPWGRGAADKHPQTCDDCWADKQPKPSKRELLQKQVNEIFMDAKVKAFKLLTNQGDDTED